MKLGACREGPLQGRPRDRRIGSEISQHRGHVRVDHAGSLGHAADGHSPAVDARVSHHRFRFEIGR